MARFAPAAALAAFVLIAAAGPAASAPPGASVNNPNVPTGTGDAILAVTASGRLEPIAVRIGGSFVTSAPEGQQPRDRIRMEAYASILTHQGRVHVIFGRRVVATVNAKIANAVATIALPPSLVLGRETEALASPTLGGNARTARTNPTAAQRAAALRVVAEQIGTTASRLIVLSLTSLDLGRGTAVVGTVNARGSGSPQGDRSLFFVAEPAASGFALSLGTEQTITIGDPVDQVNEYLVDAIDVGNGKVGLVTRLAGYDDHSFVIYTRAGNRWSPMYVGGSAVH
jgi:hypothetical protein